MGLSKTINRQLYGIKKLLDGGQYERARILGVKLLQYLMALPEPADVNRRLSRAKYLSRVGSALRQTLDPQNAQLALTEAILLLDSTLGFDSAELAAAKAKSYAQLSKVQIRLDNHKEAIASAKKSIDAWGSPVFEDSPLQNLEMAKSLESLWNAAMAGDELDEAIGAAKEAMSILEKMDDSQDNTEALVLRARLFRKLAISSTRLEKFSEAIGFINSALSVHRDNEAAHSKEQPEEIARCLAMKGELEYKLGRLTKSIESLTQAADIWRRETLVDSVASIPSRARALGLLAEVLAKDGQLLEAIDISREMIEVWDGMPLDRKFQFLSIYASSLLRRGELLIEAGRSEEALLVLNESEEAFESEHIGSWLYPNIRRAKLYALGAELLSERADSASWIADKSSRLVAMLDLAPLEGKNALWAELRRWFRVFHACCLRHLLSSANQDPDLVRTLVLAVQGRRVVSEMMESALAAAMDGSVDQRVVDLAQQRVLLRQLMDDLQQLENPVAAYRTLGDPGDGEVRGLFLEAMPSSPERKVVPGALEAKRAEVAAARQRYEELKAAAAEVPGYGILSDPVRQITLARLQSGLGAEELLLLVFPHEDPDAAEAEKVATSHLWLLGKTGAPRLVHAPTPSGDVPGVAQLAVLFGRAGVSLGAGRGGVRKAPHPHRDDEPEPLPETRLGTAWSQLEHGMRQLIWAPLEEGGALEGVSQVTVCTMGAFHNLPVASGAPEGLTVRSAGALPIFALSRGLYAAPGDEARVPSRWLAAISTSVALLSDDNDKASSDIPEARVEIAASQRLWERARDGAVIRASGVPFAEAEGPVVRLAHAACHGYVDEKVTPPLPVLRLGGGVTERDLARRPLVEGWMFMACVVGQNFDDLIEGTPVGLVNGALRSGTQTVVAFLSPVPDEIGMLTGLTITAQMSHRGTPLGKAADYARQVLDPTHPENDPDLMRLVAEALAAHRAEDFANALAGGCPPTELEQDVAEVDHRWTDFHGLAEELTTREASPSAAELTPILARHIHPRIPAETPEDRLRLGVLQHALVVFESYLQA
ncbi:tetratricopeptide repeat protein [Sulfitobacter mediterraneus]|uniref:tetratricopeptide repeat protein n=1 Tax=Sulfitobacter mediterraneus TaxID=83219 RepID=UPI00193176B1|nr:tetratricopeptide repeat protein [Sulfitobacter mediterraneus]MBM1311921.1 tetratricopeptide repeat protein [Sulfitobacter mediterraneus]MBM1315802.1 tetratricopeptide repeat protein [Sulfitobacter mediterraneus]MBM1324164.1 tetratricopeptide repeat protein [Sulfitobacter mediterraneus]MBM1328076.1 tetratricopeptide repeat protein [Sulfitobacter mediterraneus]MBM1399424.1 tetratricopeptide repeat protein [Sulfitobacter mediterraneus]